MEINRWIGSCKVRAFPWIDGKNIYVNIQYFMPGQSIQRPPAWDRTAYILNNEVGQRFVFEFTSTLVEAFCTGKISHGSYVQIG